MIGLFAVPEIISGMRGTAVSLPDFSTRLRDLLPSLKTLLGLWKTLAQSSLIGTTIGLLPGTGSAVAAVLSYNTAQRRSPEPESFGTGKTRRRVRARGRQQRDDRRRDDPDAHAGHPG